MTYGMQEQRPAKVVRGSALSVVLVCPRCEREHFRDDLHADAQYCVWCGDVKLWFVIELPEQPASVPPDAGA